MKIVCVAGARPNFMKVAPVLLALREHPGVHPLLLHTGQHYDESMSDAFFRDLGLPAPDIHLGAGSGTHAEQTARILVGLEQRLPEMNADAVVVAGDVNSTLASALAVAKAWRPMPGGRPGRLARPLLAHVEAGLRSRDPSMPEEVNRIVTDRLSDLLFTTSEDANANLRAEGVPDDRIHFVGNVMIDSLLAHRERARRSAILADLGIERGRDAVPYALLTLHRPSNVDSRDRLAGILEALRVLAREVQVLFPVHPRSRRRIEEHGLAEHFVSARDPALPVAGDTRIRMLDPLGYLDFLQLMGSAKLVLTDSGGIQEETTVLGIPCLTLRENTERPITVSMGTNVLVGLDPGKILVAAMRALEGRARPHRIPPFWDGQAARRIARILVEEVPRWRTR